MSRCLHDAPKKFILCALRTHEQFLFFFCMTNTWKLWNLMLKWVPLSAKMTLSRFKQYPAPIQTKSWVPPRFVSWHRLHISISMKPIYLLFITFMLSVVSRRYFSWNLYVTVKRLLTSCALSPFVQCLWLSKYIMWWFF